MRRILFALAVLVGASDAQAQLAGQRPGACPERLVFDRDERAVVAQIAVLGEHLNRSHFVRRTNPDLLAPALQCARSVAYAVCTDKLLAEFLTIDAKDFLFGAAAATLFARNKGQPSLLGGALGLAGSDLVIGTVNMAFCRKRLVEELQPAALRAYDGVRIDLRAMNGDDMHAIIRDAARNRRISAREAEALIGFGEGVRAFMEQ